eukprot:7718906-Pyramimonas_sp.AAC.1
MRHRQGPEGRAGDATMEWLPPGACRECAAVNPLDHGVVCRWCRVASYCCVDHEEEGWPLHRWLCDGAERAVRQALVDRDPSAYSADTNARIARYLRTPEGPPSYTRGSFLRTIRASLQGAASRQAKWRRERMVRHVPTTARAETEEEF